jgi:hypothetical protein
MVMGDDSYHTEGWHDRFAPDQFRGFIGLMKEMIGALIKKADLSESQATKVAEVLREFLKDKLPGALQGPVLAALSGDKVEDAADKAKNMLGKLF